LKALKDLYEVTRREKIYELWLQMVSFEWQAGVLSMDSLEEHLGRLSQLVRRLTTIKDDESEKPTEGLKMAILLDSLPQHFENLHAIAAAQKDLDFEGLVALVRSFTDQHLRGSSIEICMSSAVKSERTWMSGRGAAEEPVGHRRGDPECPRPKKKEGSAVGGAFADEDSPLFEPSYIGGIEMMS